MDESLYFVHTRNCKQENIYYTQETKTIFEKYFSSVKWSDPGHFLKSQGKFFFVISMYPFFTYF